MSENSLNICNLEVVLSCKGQLLLVWSWLQIPFSEGDSFFCNLNRWQIRICEKSVVGVHFLGSHRYCSVFEGVVPPCLFLNDFIFRQQLCMPSDFKLNNFFKEFDSEYILHFDPISLNFIVSYRDVHITSHLTFFHIRFGNSKILQHVLEFFHCKLSIFRMVYLRLCYNFKERHSSSIVVNQSIIFKIMEALGRVLLNLDSLNV